MHWPRRAGRKCWPSSRQPIVVIAWQVGSGALLALYVRLSPLQTLQDERTARQGAQGRSRTAVITEGQSLLNGLRNQHKDSAEIVRHEHRISAALCDQLNAARVASQALCAQLNAARVTSEELCLQLNAERVDLLDTLYRAFGPSGGPRR